jgi:protein MpaA
MNGFMTTKHIHWIFCSFAIMLSLTAGCQIEQGDTEFTGAPQIITPQLKQTRHTVAHSVENRPIEVITIGTGRETVMFIGTIHGNEAAGTLLLEELADHLNRNRHLVKDKRIVIVPVANPDGRIHRTRYNANGIDLNRNFDTANRRNNARNGHAGMTEPESKALADLIHAYNPHRIITLHQPLDCIDYDGPGQDLAHSMASRTDLPVKKLGSRPGSLGSYAGETLGIPIITVEFPREADHWDRNQMWTKYGAMITSAVTYSLPAK